MKKKPPKTFTFTKDDGTTITLPLPGRSMRKWVEEISEQHAIDPQALLEAVGAFYCQEFVRIREKYAAVGSG